MDTLMFYFFAAPSAGRTGQHGHKIHTLRSVCTFRDYFAPSGLVPLLRNGANQELSSHKSSKKKEMQKQCFRDYFVAALLVPLLRNGANRGFSSHKSSKKKEMQFYISFFLVHFQGLEPWAH